MIILLILLAVILSLIGVCNLTGATMGVGIIALACLCGILARIAQASKHKD